MSIKRTFLLGAGLFIFWFACVNNLRLHPDTRIRFFNDNYDRGIYYERGAWIVRNAVPYRDTISEYPQIPTYLFALPYLGLSWLEPMRELGYWGWSSAFSLMMLAFLYVTILVLYRVLPERKNLSFLFLLPAYLYFTYNRFDILPSLICLASFLLLSRDQFVWAAILLGIGTFTKWYPALLMPIYLMYYWSLRKKIHWWMIFSYGATCLIIILPTFLSGGMEALLAPYRFHMVRGLEKAALPALIGRLFIYLAGYRPRILIYLFLTLQFVVSPLCVFSGISSLKKVLNWSNLAIACFILFARIYSPQWILWLIPFLILSVENHWDVVWLFVGGLATYLAFPVIYDQVGPDHMAMVMMGIVQIVFLVRVIVTSILRIRIKPFPEFSAT